MTDPTLGSAREEAERLVVAALAAAQVAARRLGDASNLAATGNTLRGLLSSLARSAASDPANPAAPFAQGHDSPPAAGQTSPPDGEGTFPPAPDPTARFASDPPSGSAPGDRFTGASGAGTASGAGAATGASGARTASGGHTAGHSTAGFSTGEPQCCVCPICRVIAALRDPSPEVAERLATGAGDFAAGLASLLRALGEAAGRPAGERQRADDEDDLGGYQEDSAGYGGDPFESSDAAVIWAAATHAATAGTRTAEPDRPQPGAATGEASATAMPRKPMAKKAVKPSAPPAPFSEPLSGSAAPSSAPSSEPLSGPSAPSSAPSSAPPSAPSSEPLSGSAAPPSEPRSDPSPAMKARPGTAADGVSGVAGVAAGSDPATAADDDDRAAGGAAGG